MANELQIIESEVLALQEQFEKLSVDTNISFAREAEFALQIMSANDYLQKIAVSAIQSLRDAVLNVSSIGISLNPAKKQAYLVPRKGRVCLDISYMGLIDMATSTNSVLWVHAEVVYQNDGFKLHGYDKPPTHDFNPFGAERGELVGVYVVAKTADGDYLTHSMPITAVHSIRDRSESVKAGKSSPWKTDPLEMTKKTCVKQASKYWPRNERIQRAEHYLNTDGGEGIEFSANEKPVSAFDVVAACELVGKCSTAEALQSVWKEQGARAVAAKDKGGHAMLKNAALEKKEALDKARTVGGVAA